MNPNDPKPLYTIRYTMKKEDIMTFVSGLHDIQADMIEELVAREEVKGFPQIQSVLAKAMEKP